eukprot:3687368-Rhodomonas_salina.2
MRRGAVDPRPEAVGAPPPCCCRRPPRRPRCRRWGAPALSSPAQRDTLSKARVPWLCSSRRNARLGAARAVSAPRIAQRKREAQKRDECNLPNGMTEGLFARPTGKPARSPALL